jgi:hypothetical protein
MQKLRIRNNQQEYIYSAKDAEKLYREGKFPDGAQVYDLKCNAWVKLSDYYKVENAPKVTETHPESSQTEKTYFYMDGADKEGPVTREDLKSLYNGGAINADTLVLIGNKWVAYGAFAGVRGSTTTQPNNVDDADEATKKERDKYFRHVWGAVGLAWVIYSITSYPYTHEAGMCLVLGIYAAIFAYFDGKKLTEMGYQRVHWLWALFMTPVYVFIRGRRINRSLKAFWIMLALILVSVFIQNAREEATAYERADMATMEHTLNEFADYRMGRIIFASKSYFFEQVGEPDKIQHRGENVYLYYQLSDGVLCIGVPNGVYDYTDNIMATSFDYY